MSGRYRVQVGIGVPLIELVLPPCYEKDGLLNIGLAISRHRPWLSTRRRSRRNQPRNCSLHSTSFAHA